MIRTAINLLAVCALCCCAAVQSALAAAPPAADGPVDANTSDVRMTRLAQRLADTQNEADSATPLVESPDSASGATTVSGTPLIKRTPLLRPGADKAGPEAERPGGVSWMMQTLTALGIVIGLALAVRFIYARMGGKIASHASPVVEVLSRTTVAPRSHVMLLRVGGRVLVVSDSSAGMRTLASLEDPEEVADVLGSVSAAKPASISRGFSQLLQRFGDDHEQDAHAGLEDDLHKPTGKVKESVSGLLSRVRAMGREGGAS